jgi:2-methylcitrate dehydratase PrpD
MGQPVLAAIRDILAEEAIDPAAVTRVKVESSDRIFLSDVGFPRNIAATRASIPFLSAAAIVRRPDFLADRHLVRFLQKDMLTDAAIQALAERVELHADPAITATMESGPKRTLDARVTLDLRDGSHRSAYHDLWPEVSTLDYGDVAAKFRAVTENRLPADRAERVIEMVAHLDRLGDVRDLVRLLS